MELKPIEYYLRPAFEDELFYILLDTHVTERFVLTPVDWLQQVLPFEWRWDRDVSRLKAVDKFAINPFSNSLLYFDGVSGQRYYTPISNYTETMRAVYTIVKMRLATDETQITPVLP